jgi:predicted secreted protein
MTDQTGPNPEDEPTQPPYGAQPPPPPPYGQPGQYGQPAYGQPGQYGGMPAYGGAVGTPPANYLVWAILSTIFCCLPLGIASIVFAAQVNNKWAMGDVAGAQASSRRAKQFAVWSAVAGVVVAILYVVLAVLVATSNP